MSEPEVLHTPLPWFVGDEQAYDSVEPPYGSVEPHSVYWVGPYEDDSADAIAWMSEVYSEEAQCVNANFILRAVLCHDKMVAVLRDIVDLANAGGGLPYDLQQLAEAALREATK